MIETLLKTLAEELEMEEVPKKNKEGLYEVAIADTIVVFVSSLDPGLLFFGKLGPCPTKKREELFMFLMKANLLGQGTGGGTIGLDENENLLTLSFVLPYDINYKIFKESLEDFVNYLEYWKEELHRYKINSEGLL